MYNVPDQDLPFLDFEPTKARNTQQTTAGKKNGKNEDVHVYVYEQLEDWADIMRSEIEIKDYPNGWFGTNHKCARGKDILEWILKYAEENQKKGFLICQKMLEKEIL